MSSLQLFQYAGREIRTVEIDGVPWIVLADIAKLLGYRDANTAARILRDHHKGYAEVRTPGGEQQMMVITEQGFNRLVIRSNASNAEAIQDWVTDEVLPSIRRTGSYAAPVRELTFEEKMAEVMGTLNQRIEAQHAQLAIAAPKAEAFDVFLSASGDYDVRDAAQLLQRDHGINTGQRRLFAWLRDNHWIGKDNRPYQHRIDQDLLRIKAGTFLFKRTNGQEQLAAPQVRITPKGLERLRAELTTEGIK